MPKHRPRYTVEERLGEAKTQIAALGRILKKLKEMQRRGCAVEDEVEKLYVEMKQVRDKFKKRIEEEERRAG